MLGGGSYGTGQIGVGLAGPWGDALSYRIDAYGHYTNGERDLSRVSAGKVMSTLRFEPNAALRLELLADISNARPARYFGTPTLDGQIVRRLRKENYNAEDGTIFFRDRRFRARVGWQASDWLKIHNETYHFSADRHWRNIEGYSYNPDTDTVSRFDYIEVGHDLEQTGNRLEADFDLGAHKLVAGWEVHRARFTHSVNSPYGGSSEVAAINPVRGLYDSPDPYRPFLASRLTAHDFYLEDAWRVNDRWLLLGGIRRDLNDMSRHEFASGAGFGKKLNGTAWRLGATYRITDNTNVYAQVSRGHDPVTNILTLNLANRDFKLTTARQMEIGLKQQFGQDLGEWTAAIYQIEKKDIITRHPDEPTVAVQGGKQRSQGLELTAVLRPHRNWRLEGNYALTDAKFKKLIEPGGFDRSGNQPANVPRHSANLWVHYMTDSAVGRWQASLGARMVGSRYANNANSARTGGYTVWDAGLSWQPRHDTSVRLTVRNLTNKLYTYSAISGSQAYLGDKRRIDLTANFAF
jgi:iron complex outermembrane receptor protein